MGGKSLEDKVADNKKTCLCCSACKAIFSATKLRPICTACPTHAPEYHDLSLAWTPK